MKQFIAMRRGNIMALLALFVFVCGSFLQAVPAKAAIFEAGEQVFFSGGADEEGIEGVVQENIYAAGSQIMVQVPVIGDLLMAGQQVRIEEPVEGDVWAAGETVSISGDIDGDVRVAAQMVTISGVITGDALIAADRIYFEGGAELQGDVRIAANAIWSAADMTGSDNEIYADYLDWSGDITQGDLYVSELIIREGAEITGVTYHSSQEADIYSETVDLDWEQVDRTDRSVDTEQILEVLKDAFLVIQLVGAVTFVISAMIFYAVFKKWIPAMVTTYTKNWETVGLTLVAGLAGVFLLPIAAFILLVTIVTSGPGLFLGLMWVMLLLLGKWVTAPVIGGWLMKWFKKADAPVVNGWSTLLGAVVIGVASLWLPLNLVLTLFYLLGTGIILRKALSHWS